MHAAVHAVRPSATGRAGKTVARAALGLAVVLAAFAALPAGADARGRDDHEQARQALAAGEVLPLRQVLDRLQATHPGQVLGVELEREDVRWIYEVRLLQADGRLLRIELDARTADVLSAEDRSARRGRDRDSRR
jgi:uncharacterized membrane protein YkoI